MEEKKEDKLIDDQSSDDNKNLEEQKEKNKPIDDDNDMVYEEIEVTDEDDIIKVLNRIDEENRKKKKKPFKIKGLHMKIVKNPVLDVLCYLGINALLLCGVLAAFRPLEYNNLWYVPVLVVTFTLFDYFIKAIIYRYFQKLLLMSIGLISLLGTLFSLFASATIIYFIFKVSVNNTWLLIGSIATFLIIRIILVTLIRRKNPF